MGADRHYERMWRTEPCGRQHISDVDSERLHAWSMFGRWVARDPLNRSVTLGGGDRLNPGIIAVVGYDGRPFVLGKGETLDIALKSAVEALLKRDPSLLTGSE